MTRGSDAFDASDGVLFAPVSRRALGDSVHEQLRSSILRGDIAPGSRLHEPPLARQFAVSRGPVRDALRLLQQEGLIEITPHHGAVVIGFPENEIEPVMRMRAELEGLAFAQACLAIGDGDLAELDELVDAMIDASRAGDAVALIQSDTTFHGRVVAASGYRLLRQMWVSIDRLVRLRTHRDLELARDGLDIARAVQESEDHRDLVRALRTRDPHAASEAARRHVFASILAPVPDEPQTERSPILPEEPARPG